MKFGISMNPFFFVCKQGNAVQFTEDSSARGHPEKRWTGWMSARQAN
ncbi:hypothetical protein SBA1_320005 [Candidatus Sulfotelmatobacter kueseliae]|uniref:Uncharacterized protein n=1 Tax=Candidatus Sulfotelmatobacter kueseliae TaxID=2042962 RepID=A0A2U3KM28_9BACT|nr:hypothetical protein SBA1_320005 [Candidatus Sulfotelmatobacter kueseliae]